MKNCEQEYIKYGLITVQPACASPQPESICFCVNSQSNSEGNRICTGVPMWNAVKAERFENVHVIALANSFILKLVLSAST
jgi:hypothetical protein